MLASSLILASGSAVRATLLRNAGLAFTVRDSRVDEDAIKKDSLVATPTLWL